MRWKAGTEAEHGLADVVTDAWRNRGVQVIVESHSEHFLRRLQRRIAEEEVAADEVGLYFCELGDQRSELKELDVDNFGSITNWPTNFFGDEFGGNRGHRQGSTEAQEGARSVRPPGLQRRSVRFARAVPSRGGRRRTLRCTDLLTPDGETGYLHLDATSGRSPVLGGTPCNLLASPSHPTPPTAPLDQA